MSLKFLPLPKLVVLNVPQTTTILALGVFIAVFTWPAFLAVAATAVPEYFREEVVATGKFLRDALLLILGYYFAKVVNQGQSDITNRALDLAAQITPTTEGEQK